MTEALFLVKHKKMHMFNVMHLNGLFFLCVSYAYYNNGFLPFSVFFGLLSVWATGIGFKRALDVLEDKRLEELNSSMDDDDDDADDEADSPSSSVSHDETLDEDMVKIIRQVSALSEPVVPEPLVYEPIIFEPVVPEPVVPEPVVPEPVVPDLEVPEHYCAEEACGAKIDINTAAGLCAGCNLVYYCNQDCQKKDWKAGHKLVCKSRLVQLPSPIDSEEDEVPSAPSKMTVIC